MSGKEKLLDRIKSDCDASIQTIEQEAQNECDRIIQQAKTQIESLKKDNEQKINTKVAQINAGTKSKVELEIRNTILKKRREEIDVTVNEIHNKLLCADDGVYFDNLYSLAAKLKGLSGTVLLNEKDLKRLPSDFEQKLQASGLDATVSKEPVGIDGGFILKHGDIEENMSFSAIISDKRDEIEDLINRELFAE